METKSLTNQSHLITFEDKCFLCKYHVYYQKRKFDSIKKHSLRR